MERIPKGSPSPEAPHTIKSTILAGSGFNGLAGLWLLIAPFALGYSEFRAARWVGILGGLTVIALAVLRVSGGLRGRFGSGWLSWLNVGLGLGIAGSPLVFDISVSPATWNHFITGVAVASMGTSSALASRSAAERARGRTQPRS